MTNLTWREIVPKLQSLNEPEVQKLLKSELAGQRRRTVVLRLHQRLSALRTLRERVALMKDL